MTPVIRQAATVILTRENAGQLQVYLLRRSARSGFMAGNYVFPGGAVDEPDREIDTWQDRIDLDAAAIQQRLGGGLSVAEAVAFGVAAIRETLEEAGVLLACSDDGTVCDAGGVAEMRPAAGRAATDGFKNRLAAGNWTLAFSTLARWSHWITPREMKRRFDTRFFQAAMPDGQACCPDTWETTHGIWITPGSALAANLNGSIPLSPPTLVTLHELLKYPDAKALSAASAVRQWGEPLRPRLVVQAGGAVIVEPWDLDYGRQDIATGTSVSDRTVLPVGEPFSRIGYDGRLWRPIAR